MRKIREVLRLRFELRLGQRENLSDSELVRFGIAVAASSLSNHTAALLINMSSLPCRPDK